MGDSKKAQEVDHKMEFSTLALPVIFLFTFFYFLFFKKRILQSNGTYLACFDTCLLFCSNLYSFQICVKL